MFLTDVMTYLMKGTLTNIKGVLKGDGKSLSEIGVDEAPTQDSNNLVTSGGVKSALDAGGTTTRGSVSLNEGVTATEAAYTLNGKIMNITIREMMIPEGSGWVNFAKIPLGGYLTTRQWSILYEDGSPNQYSFRAYGTNLAVYNPPLSVGLYGGITIILD